MKKSVEILKDFKSPEFSEWEKVIQKELKGGDYRSILNWNTGNGFSVLPFYTSFQPTAADNNSYKRSRKSISNEWEINQLIKINSIADANKKALNALNGGATSITFTGKIDSYEEFKALHKEILIQYIEVNYDCEDNLNVLNWLDQLAEELKIEKKSLRGGIFHDKLGDLLLNGKWEKSEENDKNSIIDLTRNAIDNFETFRSIEINATNFHNSGATSVEEIAFALVQGNEYLFLLTENKISIDEAAAHIGFRFSSGNDFYLEIAKLRAFRMLWSMVVEQYNPEHHCSKNTFIQSETSLFYFSAKDINSNMLRLTSQSISAIIAGCDSLYVHPFNAESDDDFSNRISRNIQLILKEESVMDKVADPAGGSYFIEELTQKLATEAWNLFKELEKEGGFVAAVKKGIIQKKISISAEEKKSDFINGKIILTGVNKFTDNKENKIEVKNVYAPPVSGKTEWEILKLIRISEPVETESIKTHAS